MFRISRTVLPLLLVASVSQYGWSAPPDEPREMLARAEALYYEAEFAKSVELLTDADELLRQQTGHQEEKIDVKLQLALGFIGLNDSDRAKAYLVDLFSLDPEHRFDPQLFAPKVVRLAEDAKAEQARLRCQSLLVDAQKQLGAGNSDAVVKLVGPSRKTCPELAAISTKAADLVFKDGLESYKKSQMTDALQKFRTALVLAPDHDLAGQYVELTERKLEVNSDRALIAWHKDFNSGDFALAARDYRELTTLSSTLEIEDIRSQYRQALSSRVDTWSQACSMDDVATMDRVRAQVNALLPEPSFGKDIVAKMNSCSPTTCIQMDSPLALTRLRTRVDPQFPNQLISQVRGLPQTVRVKSRIDAQGNVSSSEMHGGDSLLYSAIRTAIDQWKFLPAITELGARCVDTEIPIVIRYAN